jgi:hypothetical protein
MRRQVLSHSAILEKTVHGIWNLLMHKTNHGFSNHFQKILLVVYVAVDIQSEQGM